MLVCFFSLRAMEPDYVENRFSKKPRIEFDEEILELEQAFKKFDMSPPYREIELAKNKPETFAALISAFRKNKLTLEAEEIMFRDKKREYRLCALDAINAINEACRAHYISYYNPKLWCFLENNDFSWAIPNQTQDFYEFHAREFSDNSSIRNLYKLLALKTKKSDCVDETFLNNSQELLANNRKQLIEAFKSMSFEKIKQLRGFPVTYKDLLEQEKQQSENEMEH